MITPLKKLQKEARQIRLSKSEKRAMHDRLILAMGGPAAPAPSPYFFFTPQFAMPMAALLIVMLGAGTTYAAEGSLPGDPLYTIKTQVSEPLRGALAFSVESKIKFHASVAQMRIEEAEALAAEDRLDEAATLAIEASFDKHIEERETLVQELEEKRPGKAPVVLAQIDSSLAAHGDVLEELGRESENESTKERSGAIAMKARSYSYSRSGAAGTGMAMAFAAKSAPEPASVPAPEQESSDTSIAVTLSIGAVEDTSSSSALMVSLSETANTEQEVARTAKSEDERERNTREGRRSSAEERAAVALESRAKTSLKDLEKKIEDAKRSLEQSTYERLKERFARIEVVIKTGSDALQDKEYEEASEKFNRALKDSVTLSTFVSANKKYKKNILTNLLNNSERDSWDGDRMGR